MHKTIRRKYANKIKAMFLRGIARKQVLYQVGIELRGQNLPCSRRTMYRLLSEFRIVLR